MLINKYIITKKRIVLKTILPETFKRIPKTKTRLFKKTSFLYKSK